MSPFWQQVRLHLKEKLENTEYATDFYRAMSNMQWQNIENPERIYSCTWRFAGGVIAGIRNKGEDYMAFYCSGGEGNHVGPITFEESGKLFRLLSGPGYHDSPTCER